VTHLIQHGLTQFISRVDSQLDQRRDFLMYGEIKVGGINVPMLANAATPLRYKQLFGKDLMTEFQGAQDDQAKVVESIPELAFIMAMAAKAKEGKQDINLINQAKYMEWLEQFDPMDLPMASEQIVNLYLGNTITSSEPKKKQKENQSEK
jgi:hypothetical protein